MKKLKTLAALKSAYCRRWMIYGPGTWSYQMIRLALNSGSLDWVGTGDLVKPFEEAMGNWTSNQISEPVQTQFGWHF